MDAGSIERLLVKQGEHVGDDKVRQLEAQIARQSALPGRDVRRRILPWGTSMCFSGGGGVGGTSPIFAPTVARAGEDGFRVSWERGLIEGVEPKIDGVPISGKRDATGKVIVKPPVFTVPPSAFKDGEAKIYFKGTVSTEWATTKLEPFASADVPASKDYTFYKLALLVFSDGTFWRALYSNQGHLAIGTTAGSGTATHLFWSKM